MTINLLAMSATVAPVFLSLTGLYFLLLGATSLATPLKAKTFLLGFASTPLLHYTELLTRLLVGGAFILHSPQMLLTEVFHLFGWLLVLTTTGLCLVPWQQHRRFTQWSVPQANRSITLIGISSLVMGITILIALLQSCLAHGVAR